ncbi:fungal-specific transcription factor domain-containing protein [Hypoxylon trugodes]|uniref:fungal-specific transcription factor domain-containing protein n=1 Tax=Hypoxylon trugodes TaxID=326681 RepID=UPI002197FAF6|nr:fungal-specific transcription factor domain-containing protein [Hypoxylon trugodes]KAI1393550.1 fungal-specific transcription factor domain-containing protein [Hypoxylon trugodes]
MLEDGSVNEASGAHVGEILSCVSCRNRKLKCDRTKPRCNRCEKAKVECIFPESRRKPAFKRRNVRELEARLAQVEVLLSEATQNKPKHNEAPESVNFKSPEVADDVIFQEMDFTDPEISFDNGTGYSYQQDPGVTFSAETSDVHDQEQPSFYGDLMDLGGIYESLPPFEVMEELNRIYFERQQHMIPIIHPTRYLQAFYSAPHMKPPMCLQYAIWALAAHGSPKYQVYHEIFYRRARQYIEADEMKGYGEHFITVFHAQAWCVISTYEAKSMLVTRAAMTSSRAVRLVQMMGLHRLDGTTEETCPTLLPAKDWTELEERRRVFWGIFCIDSHCSISTGWPFLIDSAEVTTHLPAPESAFHNGEEVETCYLHDAFKGHQYSSFAGAVLVSHIFNQILKHIHKPKANDNTGDYEYGEYWKRHRDIDNKLSAAFMFLPESFRLPENYRNPIAVHTNLNLHASIICLHHSAIDRIETYKLPESAKKISQDRMTAAAQEIVNIIKLTSHVGSNPKSPLAALALYCAASVYVYLCTEVHTPSIIDSLEFIIAAMEALGRDHAITNAYLRQVVVDIERNDIRHLVRLPRLDNDPTAEFTTHLAHNIPLLARSKISRHSNLQPPLPGRLPLGKPLGRVVFTNGHDCEYGTWTSDSRSRGWTVQEFQMQAQSKAQSQSSTSCENPNHKNHKNKRKRASPPHGATSTLDDSTPEATDDPSPSWPSQPADHVSTNPSTHPSPPDSLMAATATHGPVFMGASYGVAPGQPRLKLAHRTSSPQVSAATLKQQTSFPPPFPAPSPTYSVADHQARCGAWGASGMNSQFSGNANGNGNGNKGVPWGFVGGEGPGVDWDALGASLGIDPQIAADVVGSGARDVGVEGDGGTGFDVNVG